MIFSPHFQADPPPSFDGTFAVARMLALVGAAITLTMTRKPIEGGVG
jgi:hypothetical protein